MAEKINHQRSNCVGPFSYIPVIFVNCQRLTECIKKQYIGDVFVKVLLTNGYGLFTSKPIIEKHSIVYNQSTDESEDSFVNKYNKFDCCTSFPLRS